MYSEDEAKKLTNYLATLTEDIRALGILLTFQTGLRVGELSALRPEDVTVDYLRITRTEIKKRNESSGQWEFTVQDYPKTEAGCRYIILSESALTTLDRAMQVRGDGEYLFSEGTHRITSNAFRRKLERICHDVGVPYKPNHKIRKTFGTMLIDGGVDDAIVAEQMGHTDATTTRKFYYFSNKTRENKKKQVRGAVSY